MPIYEYRCGSCGHQQEFLRKVTDAPLTECPECKKPSFSKMVTAAGFQLKGSGWYATDFKGKAATAPKKDKDGGGETKSESAKDAPAPSCGTGCACH
jgi:putative FmdB family regulatory protein